MKYNVILLIVGFVWFLIAGLAGKAIPVFGDMWVQHLLCSLISSFIVGYTLKNPILNYKGVKWFLLPLLSILIGTLAFGILLPISWWFTMKFNGGGVDLEAFYLTPLIIFGYSMTIFLAILYPLSLFTNYLIKKKMVTEFRRL